MVRATVDGRAVEVPGGQSILQAYVAAGHTLVEGVGCMGLGVCGSCRVLVRRAGAAEVRAELACQSLIEDGMQVSFLAYFKAERPHRYRIEDVADSWRMLDKVPEVFPEAAHCRHCSGCDRACPKHLEVQIGVERAVAGDLTAAAAAFDQCIMCNLCTLACPEHIRPNHLGLFVRRMVASQTLRPVDLLQRLHQIAEAQMAVDPDAPGGRAPAG
ncbi:MAG: 2Fe-2S iron-sulfur cluster binding domain-containing protein [Azospirillum sp.]|nr:2Fe-2S iron-sulfur cluster binding domain-containing protein [Azospirillum sp.]